jgi:dTMP kinase
MAVTGKRMKKWKFKKPYVIGIEGLDGTGKETSTKGLKTLLESKGYKVKMVSFPMYHKWHAFLVSYFLKGKFGNSPYSVSPRIASLFYAIDRFFGYHFGIKQGIKAEAEATGHPYNFLIFDRYSTSNMLYQGAKGKTIKKGLRIAKFVDFVEHTLFRLPRPNKVFSLISSAEQSRDGMKNREALDILEKDLDYQRKVRKFMNTLIMEYKWFPVATRKDEAPYEWYPVEDIAEVMYSFIDFPALAAMKLSSGTEIGIVDSITITKHR